LKKIFGKEQKEFSLKLLSKKVTTFEKYEEKAFGTMRNF